jgi:signal transduction histidine kinase
MPIRCDQDRIIHILTNLIGNALSYTPQGGTVAVAGPADATTASVSITDTGLGLSKDQVSAVFDRFYRADRSIPRRCRHRTHDRPRASGRSRRLLARTWPRTNLHPDAAARTGRGEHLVH